MSGMRFRGSVVRNGKTATGIEVAAEVVEALGKGRTRLPVTVALASHAYRTTIAPMAGSFWIPLSAENRAAAGLSAGDELDVDLEVDDQPRTVEVPADLADALGAAPGARQAFDVLSYSNQRRIVLGVDGAKTDATRQRRIAAAVADLATENA